MAGAGRQAEAALNRVVKEEKDKYLAVGSLPINLLLTPEKDRAVVVLSGGGLFLVNQPW